MQAQKHPGTIEKQFARYVSQNILGMVGISAYVLADTFFISRYAGANGIAALNLVLPIYSLIFAVGELLGTGSATRFTIDSARGDRGKDLYFGNAILWSLLLSIPFILIAVFCPEKVPQVFGGDALMVETIRGYTRCFMLFTPFFMLGRVFTAFVRNDGAPRVAMMATLSSNLFNIIFDYIFIFPMGLGMVGAALATVIAPVLAVMICCIHVFGKNSNLKIRIKGVDSRRVVRSAQLGVSSFIGELAGGVVTMVFNFLILGLTGNTGVAAYGVICNISIIGSAVFNGIAQGSQPLFSYYYGKGQKDVVARVLRLAVLVGFAAALLIEVGAVTLAPRIVSVFNSQGDTELARYAIPGIKLYFTGYFFAGFNIVCAGYLSATEQPMRSFIISIMRGVIAITGCGIVMAALFGMYGVWLSFAAAEAVTMGLFFLLHKKKQV